jgi:methyl-accepting chemotaxis protein
MNEMKTRAQETMEKVTAIQEDQEVQLLETRKKRSEMVDDKFIKNDDANQIIRWVLEARIQEKGFITQDEEEYQENAEKIVTKIILLAKDMELRFADADKKSQVNRIITGAEAYLTAFQKYVDIKNQQKIAEEEMFERGQELRMWANTIRLEQRRELIKLQQDPTSSVAEKNDILTNFDDANQLIQWALEVRMKEKDFIIQEVEEYKYKIEGLIAQILSRSKSMSSRFINESDRAKIEEIVAVAENYLTTFRNYAELHSQQKTAEDELTGNAKMLEGVARLIRADQKTELIAIRKQTDTFLEDKMTNANDANQLRASLLDVRMEEKELIISKDQQHADMIDRKVREILALAQNLKSKLLSGENIEHVDEAIVAVQAYHELFQNYVQLMNQQESVDQLMIQAALKAQEISDEVLGDQQANTENQTIRANTIMLGGTVLAIMIGCPLTVWISLTIKRSLTNAVNFTRIIADGDLSQTIEVKNKDEIGQLLLAMGNMVMKLKTIITEVKTTSQNVTFSSQTMSSSAAQMSQGATEQAAAAEEASSSMEQMVVNIRQNADNALQTENIALKAAEDAQKNREAVVEAVDAIQGIAKKITIIKDITSQTRMLSLNATIEAARAQEHGQGFAVVASEVRSLAERSQTAATEITQLVSSSVAIVEKAGERLKKLVPDIQKTAEVVQEISAASKEQNIGAEQINNAIQQLDQVTQQNAVTSAEMASTAEELATQAEHLQHAIAFFKTDEIDRRTSEDTEHIWGEVQTPPKAKTIPQERGE